MSEALEALKDAQARIVELCQAFGVPLPEATLDRIRAALEQAEPSTAEAGSLHMVAPKGQEPINNGEAVPLMVHCSHCGSYEPVGQSTIDALASTAEAQARALEDVADDMTRSRYAALYAPATRRLRVWAKRIREEW